MHNNNDSDKLGFGCSLLSRVVIPGLPIGILGSALKPQSSPLVKRTSSFLNENKDNIANGQLKPWHN
jgi:hypothetical protein